MLKKQVSCLRKLRYVNLANNRSGVEDVKALEEAELISVLQEINLQFNQVGSGGIDLLLLSLTAAAKRDTAGETESVGQ